jgi:hypothetical protein
MRLLSWLLEHKVVERWWIVAGLCKDADGNGWVEGGAHGAKFKWIF